MKSLKANDSGKLLTDQCQVFCINDFLRNIKIKLKNELLNFEIKNNLGDQSIETSKTRLFNGGLKYWFKCSICQRKVGKLYLHPITQVIACRKCNKLEYRSRRFKGMIENG